MDTIRKITLDCQDLISRNRFDTDRLDSTSKIHEKTLGIHGNRLKDTETAISELKYDKLEKLEYKE